MSVTDGAPTPDFDIFGYLEQRSDPASPLHIVEFGPETTPAVLHQPLLPHQRYTGFVVRGSKMLLEFFDDVKAGRPDEAMEYREITGPKTNDPQPMTDLPEACANEVLASNVFGAPYVREPEALRLVSEASRVLKIGALLVVRETATPFDAPILRARWHRKLAKFNLNHLATFGIRSHAAQWSALEQAYAAPSPDFPVDPANLPPDARYLIAQKQG